MRALAKQLPDVEERPSRSGGAAELLTNGKCFVSLPARDSGSAHLVASREGLASLVAQPGGTFAPAEGLRGTWVQVRLRDVGADHLEQVVVDAWRLRSQKRSQYAYLGPRFFADIDPILSELRSWPELTEKSKGHFYLNGKPFLHFHYGWSDRHSDLKIGDDWGPPIPLPLGPPPAAVTRSFLAEARRRLQESR